MVLLVIVVGLFYVKAANYTPFIPPAKPAEAASGGLTQPLMQVLVGHRAGGLRLFGMSPAASIVFFAYIGFDIVATTAEETRNPQRDLPRGIIGSLVDLSPCCTSRSSLVMTGMVQLRPARHRRGAPGQGVHRVGQDWAANAHLRSAPSPASRPSSSCCCSGRAGSSSRWPRRPAAARPAPGAPQVRARPCGSRVDHRRRGRGARRVRPLSRSCRRWSASARCSRSCWCRSG